MVSITTEQKLVGNTFVVKDGRERPKDVEGTPVVASSDETVARLVPDSLQKQGDLSWKFDIESVLEGSCRITIDADADLGEGVMDVMGTLDLEVTRDDRTAARVGELTGGTAEDKAV